MALKTRRPTGRVPWPLILIEGPEKAGKSWACAAFSCSPRIGQMYWLDIAEGAADEYGAIPGANYLVIEHNGTWAQIQGAVDAVKAEAARAAAAGEPPVVLVIDSMTAEWELLKDWASDKARQRFNKRAPENNRKEMPADEEPKISLDLWNEANGRHRKLMTTLMTFPGIVLMTARGKDIAALDDKGAPIQGTREYRVEGQKTLGFDASCWIRLDRTKPGFVVGVRSVHVGLRPGYDKPIELDKDWSIEGIVFDTLRCEPGEAHTRNLTELAPHEPDDAALALEAQIAAATDKDTLGAAWKALGAADAAGQLLPGMADQLKAAWTKRKEELLPLAADDKRMKHMFVLLGQAEITDRTERLNWCSEILERPITSTKEMTGADVAKVTERTERWVKQLQGEPEAVPAS